MIINSNQIWLFNQKTQRTVPSMIGDPSVIWVTPTGPALTITWRWKTARWSASTCPSGTTIKTLTQDNRRLHPEMGNLIRPPMSGFLLQVNKDLICKIPYDREMAVSNSPLGRQFLKTWRLLNYFCTFACFVIQQKGGCMDGWNLHQGFVVGS